MKFANDLLDPSTLLADRYAIQSKLSESASAVISLAQDNGRGGRLCVLKQFSSKQRGAYLREAAAAINIANPHILSPLDTFYLGEEGTCLVYEYFPEGTLKNWMERNPGRAPQVIIDLCMENLLGALGHLHAQKRIHCDIKPENIFVRRTDTKLEFLLGDLGATCSLREALDGRHRTGSPAYMAPERFFDKFDFASDFYSVGVVCFELASGQLPFSGGPAEISRHHLNKAVPLEMIVNTRLQGFCGALLEKDPSRRVSKVDVAMTLLTSRPSPTETSTSARAASSVQAVIKQEPQRVLRSEKLKLVLTLPVPEGAIDFHLFRIGDSPMVVFDHGAHLCSHTQSGKTSGLLIAKSGKLLAQSSSQFAFVLESRLMLLDLESGARHVLAQECPGVLDFALNLPVVAWRTRRSVHAINLETKEAISHLASHYLMEPALAVLADGNICNATGAMNNELMFRKKDGTEARRVELDGPTLHIASDKRSVLAVTLDISQRDRFSIWRASEFAAPQRLPVDMEVRQWSQTAGHLFWLNADNEIFHVGIGLSPRVVFRQSERIAGFSLCADHTFLGVRHAADEDGGDRVYIYST